MKRILTSILAFCATAIFMISCDVEEVLDQLNTVTISTDLPQTFSMPVPVGAEFTEVSITKTIKASSNADITQFESRIDSYSVDSLVLKISNYEGEAGISLDGASLRFKNSISEDIVDPVTIITTETKLDLKAANDSGEGLTYHFEPTIAEAVGNSFLEEKEITIQVTGSVDGSPATFDIETILYVQVTGKLMQTDQQQ